MFASQNNNQGPLQPDPLRCLEQLRRWLETDRSFGVFRRCEAISGARLEKFSAEDVSAALNAALAEGLVTPIYLFTDKEGNPLTVRISLENLPERMPARNGQSFVVAEALIENAFTATRPTLMDDWIRDQNRRYIAAHNAIKRDFPHTVSICTDGNCADGRLGYVTREWESALADWLRRNEKSELGPNFVQNPVPLGEIISIAFRDEALAAEFEKRFGSPEYVAPAENGPDISQAAEMRPLSEGELVQVVEGWDNERFAFPHDRSIEIEIAMSPTLERRSAELEKIIRDELSASEAQADALRALALCRHAELLQAFLGIETEQKLSLADYHRGVIELGPLVRALALEAYAKERISEGRLREIEQLL